MSRRGNYVSGANGSVDWTAGVRDSLNALSRSLLDQGRYKDQKENDNEIRKNALLRDDKIRQENLQREKDIRKDDISWRESQAKEDTRRYENTEARAKANAKKADEQYDQQQQKEKALSDFNMFILNRDPEDGVSEEAYKGKTAEIYKNKRSLLDDEKSYTANFLRSEKVENDEKNLEKAIEAYKAQFVTSGLDDVEKQKIFDKRRNNLLSLRDQLKANTETADEIVSNQLNRIYEPQYAKLEESIRKGKGLSAREEADYLIKQLPENVKRNLNPAVIRAGLAPILQAPTRAALYSGEKARIDEINDAKKINIGNAVTIANKMFSASSKPRFSGVSGATKAFKLLEEVNDIGFLDKGDLNKGFQFMVDEGIDPELAAAVVANGIDKSIIGKSFPSTSSEKFAQMLNTAKQLQGGVRTSSSGRNVDFSAIPQYVPETATDVDTLLGRLVRFRELGRDKFEVKDEFNRNKLAELRAVTETVMNAAQEDSRFGNTDATASPRLYDPTNPNKAEIERMIGLLNDPNANLIPAARNRLKYSLERMGYKGNDLRAEERSSLEAKIQASKNRLETLNDGSLKDIELRRLADFERRKDML